jgi:glycosyltransferase involved in cell wall biosynthesis
VRPPSLDGTTIPGLLEVPAIELVNPELWRKEKFDLVVMNTWGMPQHTPMLVAAKSSGANVVARLDTHGYNSPWCGFWPYLRVSFYSFREHHNSAIAAIKAFSKTLLYAFPQLYDRKMLAHLSLADGIGIESQGAYKIFGGLLRSYKRHDLLEKLHVIHHPVIPEIENMEVSTRDERDNCIVAVGRWNSPQKDAPLLIKTLAKSLASNPTWRADIYGSGESELHKLVAKYAANVKELIHIHGPKPHEQILQAYQMSKICLFTSRYESGPIAGEEALCLGCSLVGPPDVPSMHDLCAPQFGTLPSSRRSADISRALQSEITQWSSQQRDPISTSRSALEIYSAQAVCKQILSYLS